MKKLVLLFLLVSSPCFALEGATYTTFKVDGKEYSVPIPNNSTREDFYMLKKALKGDEESRELLLGKEKERYFYIGDTDAVRWLILTKDSVKVKEHKYQY